MIIAHKIFWPPGQTRQTKCHCKRRGHPTKRRKRAEKRAKLTQLGPKAILLPSLLVAKENEMDTVRLRLNNGKSETVVPSSLQRPGSITTFWLVITYLPTPPAFLTVAKFLFMMMMVLCNMGYNDASTWILWFPLALIIRAVVRILETLRSWVFFLRSLNPPNFQIYHQGHDLGVLADDVSVLVDSNTNKLHFALTYIFPDLGETHTKKNLELPFPQCCLF